MRTSRLNWQHFRHHFRWRYMHAPCLRTVFSSRETFTMANGNVAAEMLANRPKLFQNASLAPERLQNKSDIFSALLWAVVVVVVRATGTFKSHRTDSYSHREWYCHCHCAGKHTHARKLAAVWLLKGKQKKTTTTDERIFCVRAAMEFVWNKFQIILIWMKQKQWAKTYSRIYWRRPEAHTLRASSNYAWK